MKRRISPSLVGISLSVIIIILWIIGGINIGIVNLPRFALILLIQFGLHYLLGFYCVRFGYMFGFSSPNFLFWLCYSLNHFQLYGLSNLVPACDPAKVAFASLGYVLVPELLITANLFVLISYFVSAIGFSFLAKKYSYVSQNFRFSSLASSRITLCLGFFSVLVLLVASIRIGPLYNSSLGQEVLDESNFFDYVSLPEKLLYTGIFAFPVVPATIISLCSIFNRALVKSRLGIILSFAASVISVFAFSIFRQRSWAMVSALIWLLPLLRTRKGRLFALAVSLPLIVVVYSLVTSLRFGASDVFSHGFDPQAYFAAAQTDSDLIAESAGRDASYNRAGLNALSTMISLQESGNTQSRWGMQFLLEFISGLPNFVRIFFPGAVRTESLLAGQPIDLVEVPYLSFVYDAPWFISPLLVAFGFTLLFYINSLITKVITKIPETGFIYFPWLSVLIFASNFASYANLVKTLFPWFVLSLILRQVFRIFYAKRVALSNHDL